MSVLLSSVLKAVLWFIERAVKDAQARKDLRDLGAAVQANESRQKAETAERAAREASDRARDGEDDPRDLRD